MKEVTTMVPTSPPPGAVICPEPRPSQDEHSTAYSILDIKQVDEDQRMIRGVATTPEPDRAGDIVEPLGIKFRNPIPLL